MRSTRRRGTAFHNSSLIHRWFKFRHERKNIQTLSYKDNTWRYKDNTREPLVLVHIRKEKHTWTRETSRQPVTSSLVLLTTRDLVSCTPPETKHFISVNSSYHNKVNNAIKTIMQAKAKQTITHDNNSDNSLFLRADSISSRGSGFASNLSNKLCLEICFFISISPSSCENSLSFLGFCLLPARLSSLDTNWSILWLWHRHFRSLPLILVLLHISGAMKFTN